MGALLVRAPAPDGLAAEAAALGGLALLAVSLALFSDERVAFPGWHALAPCLGAAALIWSGATLTASVLRTSLAVFVGRISYSLYLWHWPVIVAARIFWGGRFTIIEAALVCLVSLLLAYASWRFIEQPPRRNRRIFTRGRLFAAAGAAAALCLAQAIAVNQLHGLPGRYSQTARAFLQDAPYLPPPGCGPRVAECTVGERAAAPTTAVIGDSIALHLLPGVERAALAHGQSTLFLAHEGCRPLLGVGTAECRRFANAAIGRVAGEPDIEAVLLVSRWTTAVEPIMFGRNSTRHATIDAQALVEAFARTRAALGRRRLLVLTNVPEQLVDVPEAAADRANLGLPAFRGVSRGLFDRQVARTDALLARVTPADATLDASRALCDTAVCVATLAGRSLYADDNHPSNVGADLLADRGLFDPLFAR